MGDQLLFIDDMVSAENVREDLLNTTISSKRVCERK